MSAAPVLSVLIASRNRAASLKRLLERLAALSPRLDWEIVVVDNGSSDATSAVLRAAAQVRGVHEPVPGKGRALNRGLAAARGELVVFTDDDVDPDPAWLDELAAAAARHPGVDCFGGRILVSAADMPRWIARSRNLQEILTTEHDLGEFERAYPPNRFPSGPNMAIRRRALRGVAEPWSPDLGPGCAVPVGDERCFFFRVGEGRGKPRIYVPSALVRHHPRAENVRLAPALRRCYWGGYSGGLVESLHRQALEASEPGSVLGRLAGTRSLREAACVAVRAVGYWRGLRARQPRA